jgi:hypothetical protein
MSVRDDEHVAPAGGEEVANVGARRAAENGRHARIMQEVLSELGLCLVFALYRP